MPPPPRYQRQPSSPPATATDTDEDTSTAMPPSSPTTTTPPPARQAFDDDRLSPLEKEVLREYQKLKNNLDIVSLLYKHFPLMLYTLPKMISTNNKKYVKYTISSRSLPRSHFPALISPTPRHTPPKSLTHSLPLNPSSTNQPPHS